MIKLTQIRSSRTSCQNFYKLVRSFSCQSVHNQHVDLKGQELEHTIVKTEDGIRRITLNSVKKRNALSFSMLSELKELLLDSNESKDVKVVILDHNGPVFSAGPRFEGIVVTSRMSICFIMYMDEDSISSVEGSSSVYELSQSFENSFDSLISVSTEQDGLYMNEPEYTEAEMKVLGIPNEESTIPDDNTVSSSEDDDNNLNSSRLENLHWCYCHHCTLMPTLTESKCCKKDFPVLLDDKLQNTCCITEHKDFDIICLNKTVLETAYIQFQRYKKNFKDVKNFTSKQSATGSAFHAKIFGRCTEVMNLVQDINRPVIAQVNGVATAAGCQLVASCDLAVATDKSTFATPGVHIGLFCTTPGVALARSVNRKEAMKMLLTGDPITAKEAFHNGLINEVVPEEEITLATDSLAQKIIRHSSAVIGLGKQAFYKQLKESRDVAYCYAADVMVDNLKHQDSQEGIDSFFAKRKPKWQ